MQDELKPVAWMPIASAPKDGTMVLLWCKPEGDDGYAVQGWYESGAFDRSWYDAHSEGRIKPTNWMPLPPAPGTTTVDAHPPTTNLVAVSETPVGDHQMVEALVKQSLSIATYGTPSEIAVQIAHNAVITALTAARAQVEGENQRLWEAFKLAMRFLAPFMPGDSRAVPDEVVALAMVEAGIDNADVREIIRQALAAGEHRKDG